jgi:hypothetical protein
MSTTIPLFVVFLGAPWGFSSRESSLHATTSPLVVVFFDPRSL